MLPNRWLEMRTDTLMVNKSLSAAGTHTHHTLLSAFSSEPQAETGGTQGLIPGLDSWVPGGNSPAGNGTGHCLPSSWFSARAPWLGTPGRRASSRNSRRCCSRGGGLPAGTACTTAPRPPQSPSTSCSPTTAQVTQTSSSAIRDIPYHPKINQHLSLSLPWVCGSIKRLINKILRGEKNTSKCFQFHLSRFQNYCTTNLMPHFRLSG